MFLQGSANVPQEKRDFTQIMEFAGNAVHIPYVFMDRQRFLVSLPRGEIVSSKHQRDGFPGFRVGHSPLVMSGKIQFSRPAHGLIRFVQAPQLFQQPRMSEQRLGREQGCPGSSSLLLRAHIGCFGALGITERHRRVSLGQLNPGVVPQRCGQCLQGRQRFQCILPFVGIVFRIGESQAIVRVIGKKLEQRFVNSDCFLPVMGHFAKASFGQQTVGSRQIGRQIECFLRFVGRVLVVSQLCPCRGQSCMRERVIGLRCDCLEERISRGKRVKNAQFGKPFRIQVRCLRV